MVQFNEGNIVKLLASILLLTVALSATAQDVIPESIAPQEQPILITAEECRSLAHQIELLSKVVAESDNKTWEMRQSMDRIRDEGIFIQFENHEPINPTIIQQYFTAWQTLSLQHSDFQTQRNVAYDAREASNTKMEEGCNYKPGGNS